MTVLSVVLPVHNGEATLDEAISSIRRQTSGDFELLVIDDRSEDRSAAIAARHAAEDGRVRLLSNPGQGLIAALNFGIERTTAPLLARMDADDVARPTRFERQLERMAAEPDLLVLGTATVQVDAAGRLLELVTPPSDPVEISRVLERVNAIAHPTVFMRRDAVESVGGYRRAYLRAEDYDLWLRLAERGKLANLTEPLLEYRIAGRFRPPLFARQVLSEMAARAAATLRRSGRPDPTGQWDDITPADLAGLGIEPKRVAREITRRTLQMARHLRKLNDHEGFRDAMRLASEQPRKGIGARAEYAVRRAKVYL